MTAAATRRWRSLRCCIGFWNRPGLCFSYWNDVDELPAVATFGEADSTVYEGIEGMVLADADVETGMMYCAALTLEDVSGFCKLTAEDFHAESFAF